VVHVETPVKSANIVKKANARALLDRYSAMDSAQTPSTIPFIVENVETLVKQAKSATWANATKRVTKRSVSEAVSTQTQTRKTAESVEFVALKDNLVAKANVLVPDLCPVARTPVSICKKMKTIAANAEMCATLPVSAKTVSVKGLVHHPNPTPVAHFVST